MALNTAEKPKTHTVVMPGGHKVTDVPMGTTQAQLLDKLTTSGQFDKEQLAMWRGEEKPLKPREPVEEPVASLVAQEQLGGFSQEQLGGGGIAVEGAPMAEGSQLNPNGVATQLFGPELRRAQLKEAALQAPGQVADAAAATGNWLAENGEVPGSLAGALAGAAAGSVVGPVGTIIGGVIGGAMGSGAGSILSDFWNNEDVDWSEAGKEAAYSAGFDAVTLGVASKFKAVGKIMGYTPEDLAALWGKEAAKKAEKKRGTIGSPAEEAAAKDIKNLKPHAMGSVESKNQTEDILLAGTKEGDAQGGLTATQAGATGFRAVLEGVFEIGIVSSQYAKKRKKTNAKTAAQGIQTIMDRSMQNVQNKGLDTSIGDVMVGVLKGGDEAAYKIYGDGLDDIAELAGEELVSLDPLRAALNDFVQEGVRPWGSNYDEAVQPILNLWSGELDQLKTMSVPHLLEYEKRLSRQVRKLGEFGSAEKNSEAMRDLLTFQTKFKTAVETILTKSNPDAAAKYAQLKRNYSTTKNTIAPQMNAKAVTRASTGDYDVITKLLNSQNRDQITTFMKSLDESYVQAGMAGVDMGSKVGLRTAEEAKGYIRNKWLQNQFGTIVPEAFDPKTYRSKAKFFELPINRDAAIAILGKEEFGNYKAMLNLMAESTEGSTGMIGSLVLRGKESQAISSGMQVGGAIATGPVGIALIFGGPVFLAKTVARPKDVRKLIKATNKTKAMKKREKKLLKDQQKQGEKPPTNNDAGRNEGISDSVRKAERIRLVAELKALSIGIQQTSEDAISEIFDSFSEQEQAEIREAQRQ